LETIWDCVDCYGHPVRSQYLDETAAELKADKRTEAQKITDLLHTKRMVAFYSKREREK
jgi:hypothetical protein